MVGSKETVQSTGEILMRKSVKGTMDEEAQVGQVHDVLTNREGVKVYCLIRNLSNDNKNTTCPEREIKLFFIFAAYSLAIDSIIGQLNSMIDL